MKRYKDAFTPVPTQTVARVENTLRRLPQRGAKAYPARRRRLAVALAMALALTLCGGALAAERLGVLSFLFGVSGPTEEQQRLVQDVNITRKADMGTVTVTDAVFDGKQLSMGLIFDTDQPTYAIAEGLWLNGVQQDENDISSRLGFVNREPSHQQTMTGLSAVTNETLAGQVEVRLRLMLLQPKKEIQTFSLADYETLEALREAATRAVQDGATPVDADDWTLAPVHIAAKAYPGNGAEYAPTHTALALADRYNMNAEEVCLTFSIESDAAYTGETVYLDVANNDDLPFTVVVRRAEMTLIGSHFVLDIYPKAGGLERPADLEQIFSLVDRFYANEVHEIFFQSSSINYGHRGLMIDSEGNAFYRWANETGPIGELPERLYLAFDSQPSFRPLWQWAVELRPTGAPAAQEVPLAETAGLMEEGNRPFLTIWAEVAAEADALRCHARLTPWNDGTEDSLTQLWQRWSVFDMAGNALEADAGTAGYEDTDDGPFFVIRQNVGLSGELPDAVYLVPVDEDSGALNWDYALLLPVARE